jgi:hypothetical protein
MVKLFYLIGESLDSKCNHPQITLIPFIRRSIIESFKYDLVGIGSIMSAPIDYTGILRVQRLFKPLRADSKGPVSNNTFPSNNGVFHKKFLKENSRQHLSKLLKYSLKK